MAKKMEEPYVQLPYSLMAAKGYINYETGEAIKMSQGAKFVYLYLRARNQFFVNERGGKHFEAQTTIADAVGMDLRRVHEIILDFIKNGVIYAEKEACSNGRRWQYRKINNLLLWRGKSSKVSRAKPADVQEVAEEDLLPVEDVPKWLWNDDLHGVEF